MGKPKAISILRVALDILQIGFAVAIIFLTFRNLFNVDVDGLSVDTNCLLDGSGRSDAISGSKFCIFVIAAAFASLLVSSIFRCLRTCTKCVGLNICAASNIISIIGDVALGVWWTAVFILLLQRARAANDLGWPEQSSRDAVIGLSFGAASAFVTDAILTGCAFAF